MDRLHRRLLEVLGPGGSLQAEGGELKITARASSIEPRARRRGAASSASP